MAKPAVGAPPSSTAEQAPVPVPRAPALSAQEQELLQHLRAHVEKLSVELGPRSAEEPWELAAAADYLAEQFEASGFSLERQGFDVGDVVAQNLGVQMAGSDLGEESVIVGANYDTLPGSRGADTNATGVAALLTLADAFKQRTPRRKVRFVAYALGAPPHFGTDSMGSLRHAKSLAAQGEKVRLMVSLDSLGNYSDQSGSQQTLAGIERPLPAVGNFVLVLASSSSHALAEDLGVWLGDSTGLDVAVRSLVDPDANGLASDAWAFRRVGMPALVVSDTKGLRSRAGEDVIESVNFERLTRVVTALERALTALVDSDALSLEK